MKNILIAVLFISTSAMCQREGTESFKDTVKCVMLCSDTTGMARGLTYFQRGFEVRYHYWPSHPDYSVINEEMTITVIDYLDNKKRAIKSLVWQSQELEP